MVILAERVDRHCVLFCGYCLSATDYGNIALTFNNLIMKKFLLLVTLIMVTSIGVNARFITKTDGVCHKWEGESPCRNIAYLLGCAIMYDDETNVSSSCIFELSAQNNMYDCIEDLFVIKNGTCQEMYDFLTHIEQWGKQHKEDGISEKFDGYTLKRWNFGLLLGSKIVVEVKGKYHSFKDKDIRNIKKKLVKYAKKNDIILVISN